MGALHCLFQHGNPLFLNYSYRDILLCYKGISFLIQLETHFSVCLDAELGTNNIKSGNRLTGHFPGTKLGGIQIKEFNPPSPLSGKYQQCPYFEVKEMKVGV